MRYKHYLQNMITKLSPKLSKIIGIYTPPSVNAIHFDTNQAYGTNGTIFLLDRGWIDYSYQVRSEYMTADRWNCLWKICSEKYTFWPMCF